MARYDPQGQYVLSGADCEKFDQMWSLLTGISAGDGTTMARSPTSIAFRGVRPKPGADSQPMPLARLVRVVERNVGAAPVVQLVKFVDGDNGAVGTAFPAVSLCEMATDDELYVFAPGVLKGQPSYTASGTTTKIRWRDVRMPGSYHADLTQTGGSRGGPTSAASWEYTVKLRGQSRTLLTSQAPAVRRHAFAADAATIGSIDIDDAGVVTLIEAFEPRVRGAC